VVAERLQEEPSEDYGAPDHLHVTSKEQLIKLALEGLESPSREMTKEDFAMMRRELIEKYGPGKP
jgi:hypothetical protein